MVRSMDGLQGRPQGLVWARGSQTFLPQTPSWEDTDPPRKMLLRVGSKLNRAGNGLRREGRGFTDRRSRCPAAAALRPWGPLTQMLSSWQKETPACPVPSGSLSSKFSRGHYLHRSNRKDCSVRNAGARLPKSQAEKCTPRRTAPEPGKGTAQRTDQDALSDLWKRKEQCNQTLNNLGPSRCIKSWQN